jgi:hypothetical protein
VKNNKRGVFPWQNLGVSAGFSAQQVVGGIGQKRGWFNDFQRNSTDEI